MHFWIYIVGIYVFGKIVSEHIPINIPIKGYRLDPYFRSVAALSDAPLPLPVNLVACGGRGIGLFPTNPRNFGQIYILVF